GSRVEVLGVRRVGAVLVFANQDTVLDPGRVGEEVAGVLVPVGAQRGVAPRSGLPRRQGLRRIDRVGLVGHLPVVQRPCVGRQVGRVAQRRRSGGGGVGEGGDRTQPAQGGRGQRGGGD